MKRLRFLAVCFWLIATSVAFAQDDPFNTVINAILNSDAKSLAAKFGSTVELHLPGHADTYSASQCEMIMKDFFKEQAPDSVTMLTKGTADQSSQFSIWNYCAGKKKFQLYIFMKREKEGYFIHKLKFEEKPF